MRSSLIESASTPPPPPRLLDQLRARLRVLHYAIRTEQVYVDWARRFILYHGKRHPRDMGVAEVEAFLSHLAVGRNVSAATQNQAKCALLFLYREVLGTELPWMSEVVSAKLSRRLPVVLTEREVRELLLQLHGVNGLIAALLYGTGMRVLEGLRLRVKDVEFARREIVSRAGKGNKDRITVLPENLIAPLQQQIAKARALHVKDLADGRGEVWLPDAPASTNSEPPRLPLKAPATPRKGARSPRKAASLSRKARVSSLFTTRVASASAVHAPFRGGVRALCDKVGAWGDTLRAFRDKRGTL